MPDVVKPKVEIAGTMLAPELDALIEQIVVDDSHVLPDMFLLRFRDPDHTVLDRAQLKLGARVRIFAGPTGGEAKTLLILGEVTALEAEIDSTGTHVVARGYDLLHRLQRGLRTRTFVDTTEAEVVRQVAEDAGIAIGDIETVDGHLPFVSQANQTDLAFLRARARETGFDLSVRGDQLYFQPPVSSTHAPAPGSLDTVDPLALVFGANLNAFLPRITAAEQVSKVEVRGWNPDNQQVVLGNANAATTSVDVGAISPSSISSTFGDSTFVVGDRPLRDAQSVQRVADSVAEQIGSAFAEADGVADGDPQLRAGTPISVSGVGTPFEGQYTITASRHVIGASGYQTHFTVSGRQERSLLGLASGDTSGEPSAGGEPIYGVVIGIVTDLNDPAAAGRVRLSFPWLSDDYVSDWARLAAPGAGKDRGIAWMPEVQDEVLVAFERGDVRSPFVLGGLWSANLLPPQLNDLVRSGSVDRRVLQSRLGHTVTLSDADGKDGIELLTSDGQSVSIRSSEGSVELKAGSATITLMKDGRIGIQGSVLELTASSEIKLETQGPLSLKGGIVSITSTGPTTIAGTPLMLN